jgi:sigma-54 dependent transcriptional regulator, acetoin dehydrogenase operon transcriptional activator AcoR
MRSQYNGPSRPALPRGAGDASYRPIAAGLQLGPAHVHAIVQSHERCAALGVSRIERPDFTPLGRADLGVAFERNRRLHEQAAPVMEMLYEQIINSQSLVALTDATGTVLYSVGDDEFMGRANKVALKPGVNWSESTKGTNAVGTALVEEAPTLVHADEHYLHANHFLTCSAAPILDPRGNMLGVLDVSGDHRSYHPHTMALVKMSARMIENRWLTDDCRNNGRNVMRLHFHSRPEFIGTLMEGILALGADGKIIGANRSALEQLGTSNATLRQHTLQTLLGSTVGAMVDRFRSPLATPMPLHLADGRGLHVLARFNWPVWTSLADTGDAGSPPRRDAADAAQAPAAPQVSRVPQPPQGPAEVPQASALPQPALPAPSALEALRTGCATADAVIEKLSLVIDRGIPVLLLGDTGTGKEVLARAMHASSARHALPFVAVHCASVPEAMIEAELFGSKAAPGQIVQAEGGTLFLDEIAALPLPVQARLLRLLQDGQLLPVGSRKARPVDVTVVCATQHRLREHIAAGSFREDLFYRLNGLALRVPALRERSDLPVLVRRLLDAEPGGRALRLAPEVSALFLAYPWPGNVRQLYNVLRSASAMAAGVGLITRAHLSDDFLEDAAALAPQPLASPAEAAPAAHAAGPSAALTLEDLELAAISRALDEAGGNISVASRALGISRNTIYRKLRWKQPA